MIYYNSKFYNEYVDKLIENLDSRIPSFHVIRASGFNNENNHSFIIKNSTTKNKVEFLITKNDNVMHCKMYERCENVPKNIAISYVLKDEFETNLDSPFNQAKTVETIEKIVNFLLTYSEYVKRIRSGYKATIEVVNNTLEVTSDNPFAAKIITIESNAANPENVKIIFDNKQGFYTGRYADIERSMINPKDSLVGSYFVKNHLGVISIMHKKRFDSMFTYAKEYKHGKQ